MARNSGRTRVMSSLLVAQDTIRDIVQDAAAMRTPLRIAGRSHWIDAGRPVDATRIASFATHSGVIDYVPGDLTITVKSGTTLKEIEDITAAEGQWFPLDPFGSKDGTIGATIATGSFGPLAAAFGRARDLVLGIEFITGDGKSVRGGGRVVKNVAGFDLVRLITGSWGTLGVITEATLRLYSRHANSITLGLGVSDSATALQQRINSVLSAPGIPYSVELIDAGVASRLDLAEKPQILVRLGGNDAAVAAQRSAIESLGGARMIDMQVWENFRTLEDSTGSAPPVVIRLSTIPQQVGRLWHEIHGALEEQPAFVHSTPSLGIVRCILPSDASIDTIGKLSQLQATVIFERLPREGWERFSPSVVSDRISQRVKTAFDPFNILNPGILGPKL
jgi:glycolate oxidase FAD binding subunit